MPPLGFATVSQSLRTKRVSVKVRIVVLCIFMMHLHAKTQGHLSYYWCHGQIREHFSRKGRAYSLARSLAHPPALSLCLSLSLSVSSPMHKHDHTRTNTHTHIHTHTHAWQGGLGQSLGTRNMPRVRNLDCNVLRN